MKNKYQDIVLLLTATVNCKDVCFCNFNDSQERIQQYLKSLTYYLQNTNNNIVFAENSGYDIYKDLKEYLQVNLHMNIEQYKNRLEILTFDDRKASISRGKGYGEARILKYALYNSKFINNNYHLLKISGRIIVSNINNLLKHVKLRKFSNIFKCPFTTLGHLQSYIFVCNVPTLSKLILFLEDYCNDYEKKFFEVGTELFFADKKTINVKPIWTMLILNNYFYSTLRKYINKSQYETLIENVCGIFWIKYLRNKTKFNKKLWKILAKKTIKYGLENDKN